MCTILNNGVARATVSELILTNRLLIGSLGEFFFISVFRNSLNRVPFNVVVDAVDVVVSIAAKIPCFVSSHGLSGHSHLYDDYLWIVGKHTSRARHVVVLLSSWACFTVLIYWRARSRLRWRKRNYRLNQKIWHCTKSHYRISSNSCDSQCTIVNTAFTVVAVTVVVAVSMINSP